MKLRIVVLCLFFISVSCDGGGNDKSVDNGGESQKEIDPVAKALIDSANPLADTFGQAISSCGTQNHNTTPGDWHEVAIDGGNVLCSVWTPAFWTNWRTGLVNVIYNQTDDSNSVTIAGGTPLELIACTPTGVSNWAIQKIEASGCTNATKAWGQEIVLDVSGIQIPSEIAVVKCNRNGTTQAGTYLSQVHGTNPLCTLRFDGYMMKQDKINEMTCTLSQIVNSLKCLNKGENNFKCTKPNCSKNMIAEGHLGGFCNSFDGGWGVRRLRHVPMRHFHREITMVIFSVHQERFRPFHRQLA